MMKFVFWLALAGLAPACAVAAERLPPAADFFDNPAFSGAVLSPSGKYLAAKIGKQGSRNLLAVVDLATRKAASVARFDDADINHVQWVNDNRLLFDTADKQAAQGQAYFAPGLFAVDRDGSRFRQLASRTGKAFVTDGSSSRMLPWHTFMLAQPGSQDSDWVYVQDKSISGPGELNYIDLLRLNTVTGRSEAVERPGDATGWLLDGAGQPRLAYSSARGIATVHVRDEGGGAWRQLASFNAYGGGPGALQALAFGAGNTLYVSATRDGDMSAVYRMDLGSGKLDGKPLLSLDGYDFHGELIQRGGKLLGVHYLRDGEGSVWFDPALKALQAEIDQQLPKLVNMLELPADPQADNVLVRSFSDVQPTVYYVYQRAAHALIKVGATYPAIRPSEMGVQEQVRYMARDGLSIPAMLTVPLQSTGKNLPLVVLVHGGPYLRGARWGWDPEVQFLASRGYAVLAPEFRGSTGFGSRHFRAGWKQWGLKMQDDIADGVQWAVARGYADPQRVCIAGASYGGYATLMGLVNDPQLYRCGIDWVGVTDINLMYSGHWRYASDVSEQWKRYGMPELVGDPVQDAAQLKATSPIEQASRITRPLLLAYGGADLRVPLIHGLKFRDAVSASNKNVEWIEYPEEGHGWYLPKNRIDFWTRVEKFLDLHIGSKHD